MRKSRKNKKDFMNRINKVCHSFHSQLPVLSDSERDMKRIIADTWSILTFGQCHQTGYYEKKKKRLSAVKDGKGTESSKPYHRAQCLPVKHPVHPEGGGGGEHTGEVLKQINDIWNRVSFWHHKQHITPGVDTSEGLNSYCRTNR